MIFPVFAPSHPEYVGVDPPRKQVAQGIAPEEVICKEGLELIIKHNQSPACVKLETAGKLEERGWGVMPPPCCKTIPQNHFPNFSLSYSKEGGFAGITQNISIDTENHLIIISGFNSKTLGPISTEDMQRLWKVISENQFFELDSIVYPPVEGSADYFTYTLDVLTSAQRNIISWTDTSAEFPKELLIITQEIDRQIQFYS